MPADSRIRVLYISPGGDARGGAEKSLLGLLDGLDRASVKPSAVVLGEGSMADALRVRGIATTALDLEFRGGASYAGTARRVLASGVALRSLIRLMAVVREAIDSNSAEVVHTNGMRGHVLLPAIRRRGVSTVASIRELPRSSSEALLLRIALRSADSVIATSAYVKRQLPYARNVHVVDNPISAPEVPDRVEARRELGLPEEAFAVAMLAHFHWWKGHLDLLRAVEALDDVWVILAGGDLYGSASTAYRDEVLSFAESHGFANRVLCVGAIDEVGTVYAAADVVAHCSVRPEPFGRTLVEAALAGRPVVASSAGAPGEFITHSLTGLLFPPGNFEELRHHLVSLRDQPEMRERLSRHALAEVADRFDARRHASRVLALYQSVSRRPDDRGVPLPPEQTSIRANRPLLSPANQSGRSKRLHRWSPIGREIGPTLEGRLAGPVVSRVGVLNIGQRARARALLSAIDGLEDPRLVFDIGCGGGLNTLLLAKRFPRAQVVGIDIDPAVIEAAESAAAAAGLTNVEFALAGSEHDERQRQADLVVCMDVLEHIVDDEGFAAEVIENVAPAGTLIVHVPLEDQHYLFSAVRQMRLKSIRGGRDPHVREGYREADLHRLLGIGFRHFETQKTLGGVASVIADLEALGALTRARLPRLAALALLPCARASGGRWSKGVLAVGRGRLQ